MARIYTKDARTFKRHKEKFEKIKKNIKIGDLVLEDYNDGGTVWWVDSEGARLTPAIISIRNVCTPPFIERWTVLSPFGVEIACGSGVYPSVSLAPYKALSKFCKKFNMSIKKYERSSDEEIKD